MLTPVRAASSTSLSSHGQTAAIVASGLGQSVVAPAPVQVVEGSDLNSAIAGKLNLLLAAARQRLVEALLDAINAASEALPLPRQEGESNLAFAARLAEAIQKLPAARINEIETQLAAEGHTLPLRLIAEALKNPAGPEAARVVAYLETVGYKDRDLAARAVVRSYRQNDASPMRQDTRPDIVLQEESIRPPSKNEPAPIREMRTDAPRTQEAAAQPAAVALAALSADLVIDPAEQVAEEAIAERMSPPPFEEEIGEQAASSETPAQLAEAEAAEQPQPLARRERADPDIPKIWPAVLASITEEASELLIAIVGEQETATLLDALAETPAELEAMLDQPAADEMREALDTPDRSANLKPAQSEAAHVATDPGQIARQQREIGAQPQILPTDIAELVQQSGLLRPADGIGYVPQPYQFAKDGAERRDGQMHRTDYEGGADEEEQQAQSGEQNPEEEQEQQRPQGRVPQDLPEIEARTEEAPVADPVYALYQRMVGWE